MLANSKSQGIGQSKNQKEPEDSSKNAWWEDICVPDAVMNSIDCSGKLLLAFSILADSNANKEVVLLFSQSTQVLDTIEHFLKLNDFTRAWKRGNQYFRLDGSTSQSNRKKILDIFGEKTKKKKSEIKEVRLAF